MLDIFHWPTPKSFIDRIVYSGEEDVKVVSRFDPMLFRIFNLRKWLKSIDKQEI